MRFIAHINPDTKEEQTVPEHCSAVSEFAREFGAKIGMGETAALSGYLHDLGKTTRAFDGYIHESADHPEDRSKRGTINHAASGAKYIFDNFYGKEPIQSLTAQILSLCICSHHGGLADIISLEGLDEFIKKVHPLQDIFYEESVESFFNTPEEIPFIQERFYKSRTEVIEIINRMKNANIFNSFSVHLLAKFVFSCLIDADRLDTANFMSGKLEPAARLNSEELAALWQDFSDKLEGSIKGFQQKGAIDRLRGEISTECKEFAHNAPGVYQLCVPTGGGKTLSSLRYALEHAAIKAFGKKRIFYIIPFTSIIDQNAKVIEDILKRNEFILEHHSNLIHGEDEMHQLLTERWDSPIILTTMVQFLNTIFSDGTKDIRRLHQLADSIIIFDEIQALPVKCIHLFNGAINFLSAICNATVILCTATQPLLSKTDRPLLLSRPADIIVNLEERFRQFKRVKVEPHIVLGGHDIGELADFVGDRLEEEGNTLVILNTKKEAGELYSKIRQLNSQLPCDKRFGLFHLSTSMCPAHRKEKLEEIKAKLPTGRMICISTQLIEAGIDISFGCVVRAMAGLDSIAQAAGRCNRHGERRNPQGEAEVGTVYVVKIKNESLSMLPDIKEGKECTERVLKEFEEDPGYFGGDLLSPKAMERYYFYYYNNRSNDMDYSLRNENADLFDLLSVNGKGLNAYEDRFDKKAPYPLKQAFKTAGEHFWVIDDNTTGVLVPYGRGKELILQLNGKCGLEQQKRLIREAQQYSVNLFDHELKKMANSVFVLNNGGILALEERCYDNDLGVVSDGGPLGLMAY
jgi:CRISPR-associated endonuclease/helicase Cas3